MTPLSERVREILNMKSQTSDLTTDEITLMLLQAFREVVPEKIKSDHKTKNEFWDQHYGWNAHHDATVERIK